jgi:hypothetical protein
LRGAGSAEDLYKPGMLRERAYIRTLKMDKLGSTVVETIKELSWVEINIDIKDPITQEIFE